MTHLPTIINDLGLLLVTAAVVTIVFRKLKQPPVLGYIVAGFLVGPHMPYMPTVTDAPNIRAWGDIGVIFLLFALGLEFSLKRLARIGGPAAVTGVFEILVMGLLGYLTGRLFGWKFIDSVFLGGMLAISSTTIILRSLDELGLRGKGFVQLVFGVLIVEDIAAVLLLVLLATVALSQQFTGSELIAPVIKLVFFLTLWFLSGLFLLPLAFRRFRSHINEETLLVVGVGLCFSMVILATEAGFSPALGAFMMGSILSEIPEGRRIEHLIEPVKHLFAAVFFVSVGMLIEPPLLVKNLAPIAVISAVLILGKLVAVTTGALLAGQSLKRSIQTGASLAQIGEFSLIIAGLGQSLKVTGDFLYPVAVGVSAITTFTTPLMIKSSMPLFIWVEKTLPERWRQWIHRYSSSTRGLAQSNDWRIIIQSHALRAVIHSVLIAAIFIGVGRFLPNLLEKYILRDRWVQFISLMTALIASAPFIWGLLFSHPQMGRLRKLWQIRRYRPPIVALEASRLALAIALFSALAPQFINVRAVILVSLAILTLLLLVFSRYLKRAYDWFEAKFQENLGGGEAEEAAKNEGLENLVPWEAHISRVEVSPDSALAGQTLESLRVRERFGVTVALIERGRRRIAAPGRHDRVYPFDRLAVIGTDEQIEAFRRALDQEPPALSETPDIDYGLEPLHVFPGSRYGGKTIRDCGLREETEGLVVGLERGGERILNPGSETVIQTGDTLWVVGDVRKIRGLKDFFPPPPEPFGV